MATVVGPDGQRWRVGRRRLPWRPRRRDLDGDVPWWDLAGAADDLVVGAALFLLALVLTLVAVLLLPWLVLAVEIVLVLLIVPVVTVWRIALRRPFTVVARPLDSPLVPPVIAQVVGWRASGRLAAQWAAQLRSGRRPEPPGRS